VVAVDRPSTLRGSPSLRLPRSSWQHWPNNGENVSTKSRRKSQKNRKRK